MHRFGTAATIVFSVLGATIVGLAEQRGLPTTAAPDEVPVFRSQVEAVALDVFVVDANNTPVRGLTIDDFEVEENGKRVPVTTFRAVDVSVGAAQERPLAEPDVVANDAPEGRVFVFALAVADPCAALRTRGLLREFMERHFGPYDVATVVILGKGAATDGQDFTSNRRLILNAVDKFSGGFASCEGKSVGGQFDRHATIRSLRDVVEVLGRMPGQHKSLLYFNDEAGYPWGDLIDYEGGVGSLTFESGARAAARGQNSLIFDDAHAAMASATRNNLTIYPIDPRGLTTGGGIGQLEDRQDFRALAQITGGVAHANSNDFATIFERIDQESRTHYMLGFNSGYQKNDGKFVRVNVRVKRPGLTVRTRSGYVNSNADEYSAAKRRQQISPLHAALANPLSSPGHPLRATATAYRRIDGMATVVLTVDTALIFSERQPKTDVRSGHLDIRYVVVDAKRKIYPEIRHTGTLALPAAQAAQTGERIRLVSEMTLPEGRYQIRLASGTERTAGGAVYDLEVPDFSIRPLMVSGLTLASAGSALPTLRPDEDPKKTKTRTCRETLCTAPEVREVPLVPWRADTLGSGHPLRGALPAPPTTTRTFRRGDVIAVFGELYDNQGPRTLSVHATLVARDGSAAIQTTLTVPSSATPRPSGGYGVTFGLPLADVTPGRYVLRVEASSATGEQRDGREIPVEIVP